MMVKTQRQLSNMLLRWEYRDFQHTVCTVFLLSLCLFIADTFYCGQNYAAVSVYQTSRLRREQFRHAVETIIGNGDRSV